MHFDMFEKVIHKFGKSDNEISKKKSLFPLLRCIISLMSILFKKSWTDSNLVVFSGGWRSMCSFEAVGKQNGRGSDKCGGGIFAPLILHIWTGRDRQIMYYICAFIIYACTYVQYCVCTKRKDFFFLLFLHVSKSQYAFQFEL